MKIKKVKVFELGELSEESKEKAIADFRYNGFDHEWYQSIYDDAENVGIKITAFDIDRGQVIRGDFLFSAVDVAGKIMKEHGDICETYKTASEYLKERTAIVAPEFEDGEIDESVYEDIDEEFKHSILEDYLIILRKEFEYQNSEESIIETIEANEYEFTEDGKMFFLN